MTVSVKFWKQGDPKGNFGDTLSLMYMDKIFEPQSRFSFGDAYLVGSVIEERRIKAAVEAGGYEAGDKTGQAIFWGCGKQNAKPLEAIHHQSAMFLGVRGTHTRDALGLSKATPLGDTAFVLKQFYQPKNDPKTAGKVLWIPHIHSSNPTASELEGCPDSLIKSPVIANTIAGCESFIDAIASSKFVMANAMHAAVIAMVYGVPFCFWDSTKINFPFKWLDVLSPLGLVMNHQSNFKSAVAEYDRIRPDKAFALFDPAPIMRVAPFKIKK